MSELIMNKYRQITRKVRIPRSIEPIDAVQQTASIISLTRLSPESYDIINIDITAMAIGMVREQISVIVSPPIPGTILGV